MPINPFEVQQQAHWAGRQQSATQGATGGQLGRGVYAPQGGYHPVSGAQGQQFQPVNALGRANYGQAPVNNGGQQQVAGGGNGGRKGAFGKGNGGGGGGITIQTQYGEGAFSNAGTWGQGNTGGVGNISGNNNTVSGNMGIGNFQGTPSPVAAASTPTAPAPAGPAPAGPKPVGPAPVGPKPIGGGKPTKALPAGGGPTPPLGAGPAAPTPVGGPTPPPALGPGTGATPTPAKPQGTKDVRTREEKIADVAAQGATPGERAAATAAQGRISGAPETTAPAAPAIGAPAQQTPSAPQQAQVPKFGNPEAYQTKLGPRKNADGTEDTTQRTIGGQRLMPAGQNPTDNTVQPAAVQPSANPQGQNTIGGNIYPSTPEGDAMRAKDQAKQPPAAKEEATKQQAKKKVGNAVKKGPQPVKGAQLKAAPRAKKKAKRS